MSDIKLLPCPCCGSGKETEIGIISSRRFIFYQAVCLKCGLTAKATPTPELTASLWNTRKPMDRIVEQLEKASKPLGFGLMADSRYIREEKAIEIVKAGGKYENR